MIVQTQAHDLRVPYYFHESALRFRHRCRHVNYTNYQVN